MSSQHLTDDLCLDYLTGELPVDERRSFEDHVDECSECLRSVQEYRTILRSGLALMTDEAVDDLTLGSLPWSIEEGEKRLYVAVETQARTRAPFEDAKDRMTLLPRKNPKARLANFLFPSNLGVHLAAAASLILALALGISMYRIGLKRGRNQSQIVNQSKSDDASW